MQGRVRIWRGFTVYALLLLGLMGCVGATADGQQPEIRRITQTDATSTCIGDPKTPLCAVETFIACGARRNLRLCRIAGVHKDVISSRLYSVEYYVKRLHVLRPEDIPPHLKGASWFQPGIVDVQMLERDCLPDQTACPGKPWESRDFSVKKVDSEWHVIGWAALTPAFVE